MENPFRYAGPVDEERFCDRERELERLEEAVLEERPVFVVSGARGGKTSLLEALRRRLAGRGVPGVRVDLWPTGSAETFTAALNTALARADASLRGAAAPGRPRVALLLDDAHRLEEYESRRVEEGIARALDAGRGATWVFAGSGATRMGALFGPNGARPLSGRAEELRLGPIPVDAWLPFVLERFLETDRWIGNDHVRALVRYSGGHAAHTQALLHAAWELCDPAVGVTEEVIERAKEIVLAQAGVAYAPLWESLTPNQRRVLLGLALERHAAGPIQPFGRDFVERYRLKSPSNVQRAADSLTARDLLSRPDGDFRFVDPLLARWVRARAPGAPGAATHPGPGPGGS